MNYIELNRIESDLFAINITQAEWVASTKNN